MARPKSARPKINRHLLSLLIRKKYGEEIGALAKFADEVKVNRKNLYDWTWGRYAPPVGIVKRMAKALEIPADLLYTPGVDFVSMGIESSLTRWSLEHQIMKADRLSDSDALAFINARSPDVLDDVDDETRLEESLLE